MPSKHKKTSDVTNTTTTVKQHRKGDAGITVMIVIFSIVLLCGVGLLVYPTFADWWNRMHASRAVATYVEQTKDMSAEKRKQMLAEAHQYNADLIRQPDRWHPSEEQKKRYEKTLDVTGTGIMGYITIPKIKVQLPIYHGTEETVLQIATGHLDGTTLPVGGPTTHAAISGHTGLPSAKLLTGMDQLRKGDTFQVHVLDDLYTYKIDQIATVLPTEMDKLNFEDGADYVTLITCTPYGVNSHRLLVRGTRIPNPKTPDATDYGDYRTMIASAISIAALIFVIAIAIAVWMIRRKAKKRAALKAQQQAQ